MPAYSSLTLPDLLDAFASATPAPGGGSAAALTGAAGASLLAMAAAVASRRTPADSTELADAGKRLLSVCQALTGLLDRDADAYSSVVAANRLPAGSSEAATRRQLAYEEAMRGATEAPLDTMRACRDALRDAALIAARCAPSTRSDVAVAIELLQAAVRGAGLTVDANLASLAHADGGRIRVERHRLESESADDAARARAQLRT